VLQKREIPNSHRGLLSRLLELIPVSPFHIPPIIGKGGNASRLACFAHKFVRRKPESQRGGYAKTCFFMSAAEEGSGYIRVSTPLPTSPTSIFFPAMSASDFGRDVEARPEPMVLRAGPQKNG